MDLIKNTPAAFFTIMKIAYVDVETTGLYSNTCAIIQVAVILEVGGKEFVFNERCRPHADARIEPAALAINKVTPDELRTFQPPEELHKKLTAFLGQFVNKYETTDKYHFAAYNAKFDDEFLRQFFKRMRDGYYGSWFYFPYLDVMTLAAHALMHKRHELPNFKLATAYNALTGKDIENAHDALADIRATKEMFELLD